MPLFTTDELVKTEQAKTPSLIGNHLLNRQGSLLLVAETESGKSVVAFDMAFCLALGRPLFGARKGKRGNATEGKPFFPVFGASKVLYVDTELGPVGCQDRLRKFYARYCQGQELGNQFQIVCGDYVSLMLHNLKDDRPYDNLGKLIEEQRPDVLVLDPFAQFHNVDENTSQVNYVLKNLRALQMKYGCACILVHHESDKELLVDGRKVQKSDTTARVRGHSSISAWADTVMRVYREDKEAVYTFLKVSWPKVRHGPKPKPSYLFADLTRMYVQWVCSHVSPDKTRIKDDFANRYKARFPLATDDEDIPEIPDEMLSQIETN